MDGQSSITWGRWMIIFVLILALGAGLIFVTNFAGNSGSVNNRETTSNAGFQSGAGGGPGATDSATPTMQPETSGSTTVVAPTQMPETGMGGLQ